MQRAFPGLALLALAACGAPQVPGTALVAPYPASACPACAGWDTPQEPFRIFGNTYYVGTRGLSAVLITSEAGHILLDGGLPSSAPAIIRNIAALGFAIEDVRLILNSHAHFDHAGGIAALQRASAARVAAGGPGTAVLERGASGSDDPQFGLLLSFPPVSRVEGVEDGDTLAVGPLVVTAFRTPGHTRGGTSWTWRSCMGDRCLTLVYADSQTPVSADGFRFSGNATYPEAVADFQRSFAVLERIPCDILLTPHPAASSFWQRRDRGFVDPEACRAYADAARRRLERRLANERPPG